MVTGRSAVLLRRDIARAPRESMELGNYREHTRGDGGPSKEWHWGLMMTAVSQHDCSLKGEGETEDLSYKGKYSCEDREPALSGVAYLTDGKIVPGRTPLSD